MDKLVIEGVVSNTGNDSYSVNKQKVAICLDFLLRYISSHPLPDLLNLSKSFLFN